MLADGDSVRGGALGRQAIFKENILRFVFLKKPDAKPEKGLRGFRAIALLCVFPEWYHGSEMITGPAFLIWA